MNSFKCGDIVQVTLNSVSGSEKDTQTRLGVVISADTINDHLNTVILCPVIDAKEVQQSRIGATLLPKDLINGFQSSLALSLQIKTVSKERIARRISSLPPTYMSQIRESLKAVLDLV